MNEMISGTSMWSFGSLMMLVFAALIIVPLLVHLQKGWISAVVGSADGSAHRQSRHAVFPRIFRLAKAARKRNQARMTEHACLLTVLAAEFHT